MRTLIFLLFSVLAGPFAKATQTESPRSDFLLRDLVILDHYAVVFETKDHRAQITLSFDNDSPSSFYISPDFKHGILVGKLDTLGGKWSLRVFGSISSLGPQCLVDTIVLRAPRKLEFVSDTEFEELKAHTELDAAVYTVTQQFISDLNVPQKDDVKANAPVPANPSAAQEAHP